MSTVATTRTDTAGQPARAALGASLVTSLAYASHFVLPRGQSVYEVPEWVTPGAATLGVVASVGLLAPRLASAAPRRTGVLAVSATAVLLLLWAAGGVLFDVVALLALLTPMPFIEAIDWPTVAARTSALVAAILLFRAVVGRLRDEHGLCAVCGWSSEPERERRWLGYLGVLFGLPYPLLKTHWALGGTLGLDYSSPARDGFSSGWLVAPFAMVGLVLSLALVHRWGRIWPRWVPGLAGKATPRGLLLFGGWLGSGVLMTMGTPGAYSVLETIAAGQWHQTSDGMHYWPAALFYVSWFCWGLVLAPATLLYQQRTARHHPEHRG